MSANSSNCARDIPSLYFWDIALLVLLFAFAGSGVAAQTRDPAEPSLETILVPGAGVWITDSTGRERKARIVGVPDGVVTAADDDIRMFRIHVIYAGIGVAIDA